jgi:phospholipase A1
MTRDVRAAAVAFVILISVAAAGAAELSPGDGTGACAGISDDRERLECFDRLSGRASGEREPPSRLSRLWELDAESRRGKFAVSPYRSSYILPYTWNATPNEGPVRAAEPDRTVQHEEVKFQFSFKTKLWEDVLGRDIDLWAAYTQLSFWQFYNFDDSAPFRETNYEPELLLNLRTDYCLLGFRGRYVNAGFNHQSNGRAEPLSRSWNRAVANAGFERDGLAVVLTGWYRIPEAESEDDNPDIERFLGYGQVGFDAVWRGHRFGLLLRNNLRGRGNKGAVQIEWSFPLIRRVSGHVQYFNGYGESLLDYNASANRIGIGFVLKEW